MKRFLLIACWIICSASGNYDCTRNFVQRLSALVIPYLDPTILVLRIFICDLCVISLIHSPREEIHSRIIAHVYSKRWPFVAARNSFSQEWNNEPSDEYGNLVKRDLTETVEQTEEDLPNRVFFYLYTRNNSDNPEQLFIDDVETLNNSNFDTEKETKIVTHGWRGSYTDRSCQLVLQGNAFIYPKIRIWIVTGPEWTKTLAKIINDEKVTRKSSH